MAGLRSTIYEADIFDEQRAGDGRDGGSDDSNDGFPVCWQLGTLLLRGGWQTLDTVA